MSTKAGQVVWTGNGFYFARVQNGGPSSLNIPKERVFESGLKTAVGLIRDTPDLTFEIESWDVSTDAEAILLGMDPSDVNDGDSLSFDDAIPLDIMAPWRLKNGSTSVAGSLIIPSLYLESVSYRYAVKQNAGETFSFKGDSEFWVPGSCYRQAFSKSGTGPYSLTHTAIVYDQAGTDVYVVALCWIDTDGTYKRLFPGIDYTSTSGAFTLTSAAAALMPSGATLHAKYGSTSALTVPARATETTAVKPAALKSQHIDVYVSDGAATPTLVRWDGVQSFEATRRVTLQADEEFGNPNYVDQDYDTPDVSGTIGVKPSSVQNLLSKLAQSAGVSEDVIIGLLTGGALEMEVRLSHPDTGERLKTLYVEDAEITLPASGVRANSQVEVSFPFQSEQGLLEVIKGER